MTNPLTEEEIARMEGLHAKATRGPLTGPHFSSDDAPFRRVYVYAEQLEGCVAEFLYSSDCNFPDEGNPPLEEAKANAALFIAAKNAFPALLATIRAERERADKAEADNAVLQEECDCHDAELAGFEEDLAKANARAEAAEAEVVRLREVAVDATKALPVLKTMLEVAGLAAGAIVAEGMLAHARKALGGDNDE